MAVPAPQIPPGYQAPAPAPEEEGEGATLLAVLAGPERIMAAAPAARAGPPVPAVPAAAAA